MAAGKLRVTLALRNPETLQVESLIAGDQVPEWAEPLVHEDDVEAAKAPRRSAGKSE